MNGSTPVVGETADLARFFALNNAMPPNREIHGDDQADMHLLATGPRGDLARCSLWWSATPGYQGHRVGFIGHYAATQPDAAAALLSAACQRLAVQGCTLAVGPMDGSTHRPYRLLTERGDEPPFFLEPDNPDEWPAHFTSHGFTPLAQYYSMLDPQLGHDDARLPAIAQALANQGVCIRASDPTRFVDELRRIHAVVQASFAPNLLYSPIDEQEFIEQHRPLEPYLQPALVLIAEQEGCAIGFLFAVPDLCQARRGQRVDTVVVKTLAVHPRFAGQGIAALLGAVAQQHALECGYTRAIHALLHEHNISRRISNRYEARIIRRYTLFAQPLEASS